MSAPAHAVKAARTVYQRLLKQGRAEAEARRDAEAWVLGNLGVRVKLPVVEPPPRSKPTIRHYGSTMTVEMDGVTLTVNFGGRTTWSFSR